MNKDECYVALYRAVEEYQTRIEEEDIKHLMLSVLLEHAAEHLNPGKKNP
jgi:hypothetical protein